MDEKIKSYRQAIFKLDHAERKRGEVPASSSQSRLSPSLLLQMMHMSSSVLIVTTASKCTACICFVCVSVFYFHAQTDDFPHVCTSCFFVSTVLCSIPVHS